MVSAVGGLSAGNVIGGRPRGALICTTAPMGRASGRGDVSCLQEVAMKQNEERIRMGKVLKKRTSVASYLDDADLCEDCGAAGLNCGLRMSGRTSQALKSTDTPF